MKTFVVICIYLITYGTQRYISWKLLICTFLCALGSHGWVDGAFLQFIPRQNNIGLMPRIDFLSLFHYIVVVYHVSTEPSDAEIMYSSITAIQFISYFLRGHQSQKQDIPLYMNAKHIRVICIYIHVCTYILHIRQSMHVS